MPPATKGKLRGVSGLPDDIDAVVTSAMFTYDADYAKGQACIMRMELTDDDGEEHVLKLSTGKGWEPEDKGASAKREDGKDPVGFQNSCAYQVFLDGALDNGAEDVMVARDLNPWDAGLWLGLKFHLNRQKYKDMDDKERDRLVPSAFLGEAGDGKKAKPAAAAKPKPAVKEAEEEEAVELPAKIRGKLKKIAAETDSHDAFMERAYSELDDADSYEAVISDDSDEGFYVQNHE